MSIFNKRVRNAKKMLKLVFVAYGRLVNTLVGIVTETKEYSKNLHVLTDTRT